MFFLALFVLIVPAIIGGSQYADYINDDLEVIGEEIMALMIEGIVIGVIFLLSGFTLPIGLAIIVLILSALINYYLAAKKGIHKKETQQNIKGNAPKDYMYAIELNDLPEDDVRTLGVIGSPVIMYATAEGPVQFEPSQNHQRYYLRNVLFQPQRETDVQSPYSKISKNIWGDYTVHQEPGYSNSYEVNSPAILTLQPVGKKYTIKISPGLISSDISYIEKHFVY